MAAVTMTLGDARIDRVLPDFVGALELTFPARLRAMYISGSYASRTSTPASDLDGMVIFRGRLRDGEREIFASLARSQSRSQGMHLDLVPRGEEEWFATGEHSAKTASRVLVYGEDVSDRVRPAPLWRHVFDLMQGSWFYLGHLRGGLPLRVPLDYPDPDGEFYGYERNGRKTDEGWTQPGTKALVAGVTLAASTLVGIRAEVAIVRSGDSVTAYKQEIGDAWSPWIEELYQRAKQRWAYQVPSDPADRQVLRALCAHALAFENSYLAVCRDYLQDEREQPDPERRALAVEGLSRIDFQSLEVSE